MFIRRFAALLLALSVPAICASGQVAPSESKDTYFVFGVVTALGPKTVEVRTFDQQKLTAERHTFSLTTEIQRDIVRTGDAVELIVTVSGSEWTLHRLITLSAGIPMSGPPPSQIAPQTSTATAAPIVRPKPVPRRPAGKTLATAAPPSPPAAPSAVNLPTSSKPKVAAVIPLSLGASEASSKSIVPGLKNVPRDIPSEECHRSDPDWPSQPIRIAILDFRFPAEREEARDLGTKGGGSGTAVADLVFDKLGQNEMFALSRGDRDKLFRADFAGAARTGRQLGADAVLTGTFSPVGRAEGDTTSKPKAYELHGGVVDTCTGQLLIRLVSEICAGATYSATATAVAPAKGACAQYPIPVKAAEDPKANPELFRASVDALLDPLEHGGPPPPSQEIAGVVTTVQNQTVTFKTSGTTLHTGDQVAIHASRLSKSPSTYTLRYLQDEEIGRVTLASVQGSTAVGTFVGDYTPKPGDTAELIPR